MPASELARAAGVCPSTASEHLAKLVEGGLLSCAARGRQRYFRIANAEVAHAVEAISAIAPLMAAGAGFPAPLSPFRRARTCYDHLAGVVGVGITESLLHRGFLVGEVRAFDLTPAGAAWLGGFGIDVEATGRKRRQFATACLDLTERRHHLAGALGSAIAGRVFELEWARRTAGSRALRVTAAGEKGLAREFGLR